MANWYGANRLDGGFNLDDVVLNMAVDATGGLFITGQSDRTSGDYEMWSAKFIDRLIYTPPLNFVGVDTIHYTLTDSAGTNHSASVDVAVTAGSFRLQSSPVSGGPNPAVMLQVSGIPGTNCVVIEATSDFNGWQPLATNSPVSGSIQWLDSGVGSFSNRFYRAFQPQ